MPGQPMSPEELCYMTADALRAGYSKGTFSPLEICEVLLARMSALNDTVNAYVLLGGEELREAAKASSARWRARCAACSSSAPPATCRGSTRRAARRCARPRRGTSARRPSRRATTRPGRRACGTRAGSASRWRSRGARCCCARAMRTPRRGRSRTPVSPRTRCSSPCGRARMTAD